VLGVLALVEHDLHRHALHDLHVVARRVLRGQQAELRARGGRHAVDVAAVLLAAVGIHGDRRGLARAQLDELVLLEVRGDPDVLERDDRQQRLAGLHDLAQLRRAFAHDTGDRRLDGGVLEVELRLSHRGLGLRDLRLGRRGMSTHDRDLLWPGARLAQPRLGCGNRLLGLLHGRNGALLLGPRGFRGHDGRVVFLARDLVLRDQGLHALEVLDGFGGLRLRLAQPRPRRTQARLARRDLALGGLDAAGRAGRGDRHALARRVGRRDGLAQIRLGAIEGHLVVARVELHQQRSRVHVLVVLDLDGLHGSADAGRDAVDVTVDLRVVGRLAHGIVPPEDDHQDRRHDRGHGNDAHRPAAVRPRLLHLLLLGHHSPRTSCLNPDSATPRARARDARATLRS
jgi:hypothetical protein